MIYKYYKSILYFLILLLFSGCGVYESSLTVSIRSNDVYSVKSRVESGEDVNALSLDLINGHYWKTTPLISASITGNVEIIRVLLEAGADVNGIDEWGNSALMAAAEFEHDDAARLLIGYGADVDAIKKDMTTALAISARKGNLEIVRILIDAGANVNIGHGDETVLSLAARSGNLSVVETLVESGAEVNRWH